MSVRNLFFHGGLFSRQPVWGPLFEPGSDSCIQAPVRRWKGIDKTCKIIGVWFDLVFQLEMNRVEVLEKGCSSSVVSKKLIIKEVDRSLYLVHLPHSILRASTELYDFNSSHVLSLVGV